ncbi:hypothetical protein E6C76_08595 [Pseudothauera nasutitermitis]|uniref:Uncharacterized protein n=1 Tax=Pseudothauera nasutitermitis TaxID=2565930 RepID=A0A4S4AZK1_9RHOO|nr:hypothetical protein [Pseudothauera nasutitermitis]THF65620.1 hypothetical protein E6C76_08595 [Pseudothauera nasutitermitis]
MDSQGLLRADDCFSALMSAQAKHGYEGLVQRIPDGSSVDMLVCLGYIEKPQFLQKNPAQFIVFT